MDAEAEISNMFYSSCKIKKLQMVTVSYGRKKMAITPHTFDMSAAEDNLTFTPLAPLAETYPVCGDTERHH